MRGQHFFTSDPHFGCARIIEISKRPFASPEEADEAFVERWNAVVGPQDVGWILGDVTTDTGPSEHIARLNGTLYLIAGNHDTCSQLFTPDERERKRITREWLDSGFRGVVDGSGIAKSGVPVRIQLPGGRTVDLSHYPHDPAPWEVGKPVDEFAPWRPRRAARGAARWVLHGHVHGAWAIQGNQFNVGVDIWFHEPVPAELIAGMIDAEEASRAAG